MLEKKNNTYSLELSRVTKKFPGVIAVDEVSFQVYNGEFFSLLGPSGCGKTTTLRLIGGLEKPDTGEIKIDGKVVNDQPPYKRDSSIVFQNLALFPHMSVQDNVAFGLKLKKETKNSNSINKTVDEILKLVKLQGFQDRRPNQLSGGQQQRVALARSLVLKPEVLLLDEPLSSLDRKLRKEMQVELKRIQKEVNTTFVYVTHDQKVALGMSDRLAIMKDGKILQNASPNETYTRPSTRFVANFLGLSNIFRIKSISKEKDILKLTTPSGLTIKAKPDKEVALNAENKLCVTIQPNKIKLLKDREPDPDENVFRGKVRETIYQGDFTEIEVTLDTGKLITIQLDSSDPFSTINKGEDIFVSCNSEDCILLIDDQ